VFLSLPPFPFVKVNHLDCQVYVCDCQAITGSISLAKPIPGPAHSTPVSNGVSFERPPLSQFRNLLRSQRPTIDKVLQRRPVQKFQVEGVGSLGFNGSLRLVNVRKV
jgi:hypothetical protein